MMDIKATVKPGSNEEADRDNFINKDFKRT